MEIWQAIVLGAVQGFAEFLPISSSGHLILLQHWFGINEGAFFFTVMLHIGTLIPVCLVLRKEIVGLFKNGCKGLGYLVLATIPAGIIGLVFDKVLNINDVFDKSYVFLAVTFVITAIELIIAEIVAKKERELKPLTVKSSFAMGVGQAIGVLPGISRSGSTLTAGIVYGVNREDNSKFTFLMSIPIILAAVGLSAFDCVKERTLGDVQVLPLVFGIISAMITGYIAVKFMLRVIRKANYKWFSLYLTLLAIAVVVTYAV